MLNPPQHPTGYGPRMSHWDALVFDGDEVKWQNLVTQLSLKSYDVKMYNLRLFSVTSVK